MSTVSLWVAFLCFCTVQMKDARLLGPERCAHVETFLHAFSLANAGVGAISLSHISTHYCFKVGNRNVTASFFHRSKSTSNSNSVSRPSCENLGRTASYTGTSHNCLFSKSSKFLTCYMSSWWSSFTQNCVFVCLYKFDVPVVFCNAAFSRSVTHAKTAKQ